MWSICSNSWIVLLWALQMMWSVCDDDDDGSKLNVFFFFLQRCPHPYFTSPLPSPPPVHFLSSASFVGSPRHHQGPSTPCRAYSRFFFFFFFLFSSRAFLCPALLWKAATPDEQRGGRLGARNACPSDANLTGSRSGLDSRRSSKLITEHFAPLQTVQATAFSFLLQDNNKKKGRTFLKRCFNPICKVVCAADMPSQRTHMLFAFSILWSLGGAGEITWHEEITMKLH